MQPVRKINDELAVAGQITPDQLQELVMEGYRSILNLRLPSETGFLSSEQHQAAALGLYYINFPVRTDVINNEVVTQVLQQIRQLPKPLLVHCDSAIRSAALALIYISTQRGITLTQAIKRAEQLGVVGILSQS